MINGELVVDNFARRRRKRRQDFTLDRRSV